MLLFSLLPVPSRHCRAAGAAAQHISSFRLLQHPAPLLAHIPQPQPPPLLRRGGSLRLHARRLACELPLSAARAQALREGDLWLQLSRLLHAPFLLPLLPLHPLLRASSGLSFSSPPRLPWPHLLLQPCLFLRRKWRISRTPSISLHCRHQTPSSPSTRRPVPGVTQCPKLGYFCCSQLFASNSVVFCLITREGKKFLTRRC